MLATYRDYVSYGAMGFYPGEPLGRPSRPP